MFDIGWSELLVIAVVTIIVVGPKDLPRLLRSVGQIARKVRTTANEFRGHVDDVIRDAELEDLKSTMDDVKSMNPINQVKKAVMDEVDGVRDIIEDDGVRNYHKDFPDDEPYDDFDDPGAEWDDEEDGLTSDPLFDDDGKPLTKASNPKEEPPLKKVAKHSAANDENEPDIHWSDGDAPDDGHRDADVDAVGAAKTKSANKKKRPQKRGKKSAKKAVNG